MAKRPNFESFKKELNKNELFVAEYERLRPEFELIREFIKARIKSKYSQQALAKKLKLQQPAIARLEQGGYASTSFSKLSKFADAMGYEFKFSLEPKKISKKKI
ncbi:MAG: hypothetical protein SZ59_C0001G0195 [candidate division TM6 bacterium GW2011_GWF2_28_16]|nr:MAG: hypothetical protein SZ59_C0001G0195 [candidate division TM6 bacterium GW2011_GWF2_28_16]